MDEKKIENDPLFDSKTDWDTLLVLLMLFASDLKIEKDEKKEKEEG